MKNLPLCKSLYPQGLLHVCAMYPLVISLFNTPNPQSLSITPIILWYCTEQGSEALRAKAFFSDLYTEIEFPLPTCKSWNISVIVVHFQEFPFMSFFIIIIIKKRNTLKGFVYMCLLLKSSTDLTVCHLEEQMWFHLKQSACHTQLF